MKRLTILAAVLILASCAKETQFVNARLDFAVTDNAMTRVSSSDIHSAVTEAVGALPVRISYGKVGSPMNVCDAGAVVALPVGDIRVRLEYYGESQIADDVMFYTVPYIYADTTITFHSYYSELVVRAHFRCAMIAVDPSETDGIRLGGNTLNLADYGSFQAFYVSTDTDGATTEIEVYAKEQTDFRDRTLTIDPSQLKWGKWYALSPTGITQRDAELNYDIDTFTEGGRI